MAIDHVRQTKFWSAIRATPFTVLFYALALSIAYPNPRNFLFLASYCINFIFNGSAKYGTKLLYNLLGVNKLPLLGIGARPSGATNCSTFLTCPDMPAISFGMPSGHSQHAWFFATFLILELSRYYKLHVTCSSDTNNCNPDHTESIITKHPLLIIILSILLVSFATIVSYSRVSIDKCHTIQQVIVGGILGIGFAFLSHWIISIILKK